MMELPASPLSSKEVDLFVDEARCGTCGQRAATDDRPAERRGAFTATCALCRTVRELSITRIEPHQNIVGCDFTAGGAGGPDEVGAARLLAAWRKGSAS